MSRIRFNKPCYTGEEDKFISDVIKREKLSGGGYYADTCHEWFSKNINNSNVLLTTSCTHAIEMSAILADIQPGDEVVMPSYTFVSTANAFVVRGAKIVFCDIRPDTMNIDENKIREAITPRTKAIVPVHYAGVGCEMDTINDIAKERGLAVIEDAAQGMMSTYKGQVLGTIGDFGTYSFHDTKNITSGGEGGLLICKNPSMFERAEIIREKGTDRNKFFRGQVDKYTWCDLGSSYILSEFQAAYLWGQLVAFDTVFKQRMSIWNRYSANLAPLVESGHIEVQHIPEHCTHNAHMFYIKVKDIQERSRLIKHLEDNGVTAVFHYIPLHSSDAGMKFGRFSGTDQYTTRESERLLRLPIYYGLSMEAADRVSSLVFSFFEQ